VTDARERAGYYSVVVVAARAAIDRVAVSVVAYDVRRAAEAQTDAGCTETEPDAYATTANVAAPMEAADVNASTSAAMEAATAAVSASIATR
jgi:hypothetical protein